MLAPWWISCCFILHQKVFIISILCQLPYYYFASGFLSAAIMDDTRVSGEVVEIKPTTASSSRQTACWSWLKCSAFLISWSANIHAISHLFILCTLWKIHGPMIVFQKKGINSINANGGCHQPEVWFFKPFFSNARLNFLSWMRVSRTFDDAKK